MHRYINAKCDTVVRGLFPGTFWREKLSLSALSWPCSEAKVQKYFLVLKSRQPQLCSVLSLSSFLQRVLAFVCDHKETLGHCMQPSFLHRDGPSSLGLTMLLALACCCLIPHSWRKGKVGNWVRSPLVRRLVDQSTDNSRWLFMARDYFLVWELLVVCALWQWKTELWWGKGGHKSRDRSSGSPAPQLELPLRHCLTLSCFYGLSLSRELRSLDPLQGFLRNHQSFLSGER